MLPLSFTEALHRDVKSGKEKRREKKKAGRGAEIEDFIIILYSLQNTVLAETQPVHLHYISCEKEHMKSFINLVRAHLTSSFRNTARCMTKVTALYNKSDSKTRV